VWVWKRTGPEAHGRPSVGLTDEPEV
jgi:hypothetical protein